MIKFLHELFSRPPRSAVSREEFEEVERRLTLAEKRIAAYREALQQRDGRGINVAR